MKRKKIRRMVKKMKKVFALLGEMVAELYYWAAYTFKANLYVLGAMIELSTPYIMWYLVVMLHEERGQFAVGGEVFIPFLLFFISRFIKRIANNNGQGYEIPVASKRFTIEEEYGKVTILEEDIQEIILYLNDVENYIEKKGMQRWES